MDPTYYRITIRGRAPHVVSAVLDGVQVCAQAGETVLVGEILDASHLYGVIDRLQELGLELIGLEQVGADAFHPPR